MHLPFLRSKTASIARDSRGSQEAPSTAMSQDQGAGPASEGDRASPCPLASPVSATTHSHLPITEAMVARLRLERAGHKRHRDQSKEDDIYIDAVRRLEKSQAAVCLKMEMIFQQLQGRRVRDYPDDCVDFCNSLVPMMEQMLISKRLIFRDRVNTALRELLDHPQSPPRRPYTPHSQIRTHFPSTPLSRPSSYIPCTPLFANTRAPPQSLNFQPIHSAAQAPNPLGFRLAAEHIPVIFPAKQPGGTWVPSSPGSVF